MLFILSSGADVGADVKGEKEAAHFRATHYLVSQRDVSCCDVSCRGVTKRVPWSRLGRRDVTWHDLTFFFFALFFFFFFSSSILSLLMLGQLRAT